MPETFWTVWARGNWADGGGGFVNVWEGAKNYVYFFYINLECIRG